MSLIALLLPLYCELARVKTEKNVGEKNIPAPFLPFIFGCKHIFW